jgi:lipid-binding SYLF domain-containing protein
VTDNVKAVVIHSLWIKVGWLRECELGAGVLVPTRRGTPSRY